MSKKKWKAVDPRDGQWKEVRSASYPPTKNSDGEDVVTVTFSDGYKAVTPLDKTNYGEETE